MGDKRRPRKLVLSKDTVFKLNSKTLEDAELRAAAGGQAAAVTDFNVGLCAQVGQLTLNGCRGPTNFC